MKIEEGKFYRTRNGDKVGPAVRSGGAIYPWNVGGIAVTDEGRFQNAKDIVSNADLVAEWDFLDAHLADELADEPILDLIYASPPEEAPDIKTQIADEAKRIVGGARRANYGTPENSFGRIARFWEAYFKNTGRDISVTAADVSPLMRLMKEARLCETPTHLDSHVDMVGYTLTGAEVNGVKFPLDSMS